MQTVTLQIIALSALQPNSQQPRKAFAPESLQILADTIKQHGVLEPLIVRKHLDHYQIIAGERRWRAAGMASLREVPCLVRDYSDQQVAQIALIENMAREDLNAMEIAHGIAKIIQQFKCSQEEVAAILGQSGSQVSNLLRLLRLDSKVQRLLTTGELSFSHGKIIAGVMPQQQYAYALKSIKGEWSKRKLESEIAKSAVIKTSHSKDVNITALERQLSELLNTSVTIDYQEKKRSGKLIIPFNDLDRLDGILAKLGHVA